MDNLETEIHPLGFFLPREAKILMLGSFPPKRERWSMNFYYPNFINDMWRIMGLVFFDDREHFILPDKKGFNEGLIRKFCLEKGIAIGDTSEEIIRLKDNASDKFLEVVKPIDPDKVLTQIPECRSIVITGQKAMDTFRSVINADEPKAGGYSVFSFSGKEIRLYRMPSSSRAYPMALNKKAEFYRTMFEETGLLQAL